MLTRLLQRLGLSESAGLFRDRDFARLWSAQVISVLGDYALLVALPVTVYNATGSKTALGISIVCGTLPAVLFSLLGGVLADRWDRRRTMVVSDLGRMLAILLLLGMPGLSGHRHFGSRDLGLFYAVSFLVASFSCFFSPARASLLRSLMPPEKMFQANSFIFTGVQAAWLLGPALGGVLLAWLHPKGVFTFDAATFAASAVLVSLIRRVPPASGTPKPKLGPAQVWSESREGLAYVWNSPILRPSLVVLLLVISSSYVVNTLEFPFVRDLWHGSAAQYALLVSIGFGGAVLTGIAGAGPLKSVLPARLLAFGLGLMAATGLVFSVSTSLFLGGAMLFISGVGNAVENMANLTLFQTCAPPRLQGRVSATVGLMTRLASTVGGLTTAALTGLFPSSAALRPMFAGVALVSGFCALLAWLTLRHITAQDVVNAGVEAETVAAAPQHNSEPARV